MIRICFLMLSMMCVTALLPSFAQNNTKSDTTRKIVDAVKDSKVSQDILKSVTRKPQVQEVLNIKSEEAFLPYEGKIIRTIIVNHIGFEKSITDTTSITSKMARIGNALHVNSKEWVIRDHVFFQEKKPLNA